MGLGKSIQTISFLTGLFYSGIWPGTAIIVCPATVMKQWVQEFHRWWPPFRVAVLHSTGSHLQNGQSGKARDLVKKMHSDGHVIITTYSGIKTYENYLMGREWGYVILDEGHKIRNPDAVVSLACKRFRVCNITKSFCSHFVDATSNYIVRNADSKQP